MRYTIVLFYAVAFVAFFRNSHIPLQRKAAGPQTGMGLTKDNTVKKTIMAVAKSEFEYKLSLGPS